MSTLLHFHDTQLRVQNYQNQFLLIQSEDLEILPAFGKAVFSAQFNFIEEVIVSEVEICLKLASHFKPFDLRKLLSLEQVEATQTTTYRLPIYMDLDADWERVQTHSNLPKSACIPLLTSPLYSISMFGFLPGFVYCTGLPEAIQIPRKSVPSKYIEAGSLAIGGKYLGLYALNSPGGWNVIGKCPISLLQIPQTPPVAVQLGDQLQLEVISKRDYQSIQKYTPSIIEYNA